VEWLGQSSYTTAGPLPEAMVGMLQPAGEKGVQQAGHQRRGPDVHRGVPTPSSFKAMQTFGPNLKECAQASRGNRHDALVSIVGFAFGMVALDLRDAGTDIDALWLSLVPGERRDGETWDVATWVTARDNEACQGGPGDGDRH
jgi:hypothetical protein